MHQPEPIKLWNPFKCTFCQAGRTLPRHACCGQGLCPYMSRPVIRFDDGEKVTVSFRQRRLL